MFCIVLFFITKPANSVQSPEEDWDYDMDLIELREEIRSLKSKTQSLERIVSDLVSNISVDKNISQKDLSSLCTEKDAYDMYNKAFELLKQSKFLESSDLFKKIIDFCFDLPSLVEYSYYWLGEISWLNKKYEIASDYFLRSYNKNTNGQKSYLSLFKAALCFKNIDHIERSCLLLEKVISSPAPQILIDQAKREINKICYSN